MKTRKLALILLAIVGVMFAATPVSACTEGLTPGFWKQEQHFKYWTDPYDPPDLVRGVFTIPTELLDGGILDLDGDGDDDTLLDALWYRGGSGLEGAARILLRAAVAALLNAAHPEIDYTSTKWVRTNVNSRLASLNRGTMLNFAGRLDDYNNLGLTDELTDP